MKKKSPKGNGKRLFGQVMIVLMFMVGSMIALYPFYINALNNFLDEKRMEQMQTDLAKKQDELKKREEENKKLAKSGFSAGNGLDPFEEEPHGEKEDSYYAEHAIGSIAIPTIEVDIPLYDTTNNYLLNRGATVLQGTSFPSGGADTHTVISAHSGLPDRNLFTNLEDVKKGDQFVLTVYGKKLAYEVHKIEVVVPQDTSKLKIEPGQDLATLITCTPYMINSHRLLVTGHRVPYSEELKSLVKKGNQARETKNMAIIAGTILLVLLGLYLLYRAIKGFMLRRRRFDLVFLRENATGEVLPTAEYALFTKKGKSPIIRNGDTLKAKADAAGKVVFTDLPGSIYTLKEIAPDAAVQSRVGIKKWRQKQMRFYPKGKQKAIFVNEEALKIKK